MALEANDLMVVQKQSGAKEIRKATLQALSDYMQTSPGVVYKGVADFTNAGVRVDFVGATLDNALFDNTNLREADLSNASAIGADFTDADFESTDLTQVNFTDATLEPVRWTGATCPDKYTAPLCTTTLDMRGSSVPMRTTLDIPARAAPRTGTRTAPRTACSPASPSAKSTSTARS